MMNPIDGLFILSRMTRTLVALLTLTKKRMRLSRVACLVFIA